MPDPAKGASVPVQVYAAGGAVHLAASCAEVRRVGVEPDHAGETGENGLVGDLVLHLDIAAVAGLIVVRLVAIGLQVVDVDLEVEFVTRQAGCRSHTDHRRGRC